MTGPQKIGVGIVAASALNPAAVGVGVFFLIGLPLILVYGLVSEIVSPSPPLGPLDSRPVATRITGPVEMMAGDLNKYDSAQLEQWFEARSSFAWSVAAECATLPKHGVAWRWSREGKVCTAATQAYKRRPW